MRGTLEKILQKFGVNDVLRPYETMPFDYFNAEKGIDIMAEVGLSGDKRTINAAIQHIQHRDDGEMTVKQIFIFQAEIEPGDIYMAKTMRVLDQNVTEKFNWFESGCNFFNQCTSLIKKGTPPDFEQAFKKAFGDGQKDSAGEVISGGSGSRNFKNDKPSPPPPKPPGKL